MRLKARNSRGKEVGIFWSLPISAGVILVGLVLFFLIGQHRRMAVVPATKLRLAILVIALGSGVGGGVIYWTALHGPDILVTGRVSVISGHGMRDGKQASIIIPGAPPQRDHLALIPILNNPADVGDCVNPARLEIAPMIDGQQRQALTLQPGHEVRLDLTGAAGQVSILVTLHVQDASCRVDLSVGQAVLYN